jgi:manganese/zinc/iron transport system ATP- binding protein
MIFLPYDRRPSPPWTGRFAIEAEGVTARYPGVAAPALSNFSLTVPAGSRTALVGSNGAGKSTFLRAAAGLMPVESGSLLVLGRPAGWCRCRVAYLPQKPEVEWRFPAVVQDVVLTGRDAHLGWLRRPGADDRARARRAMERTGISDLASRPIHHLSGGQQQRVLIARALAQEADLFLLDEPLNAVDAETRSSVGRLLNDLCREGRTVLMATHHLGGVGEEADLAVYLSEGRQTPAPCEHPEALS